MASVSKRKWTHNGASKEAWAVRYFDEKSVRRSKTFDLKKDAEAFRRKVEREIEDGTHVATAQALTIAEVGARFVANLEERWARGEIGELHVIKVRRFVNLHIAPEIGNVRFRDVTAAHVDSLYHAICQKMKPHCARQVVGYLGTLERFANRHRWMLTTPVDAALRGFRKVPGPKVRTFEREEVMTLLRMVLEHRPGRKVRHGAMFACMVHLAACCGLRIGEILGLPIDAIDLDRGVLSIRQSLTILLELKGPKTAAGVREVPLPPHLVAMLRDWLARHHRPNEWGLAFTSGKGRKVFSRNITKAWHALLDEAGMLNDDPYHFHALRHFAGSWWLHNGMAIPDVTRLLGHANPAITMQIYAHSVSKADDRHRAVAQFGAQLLAIGDATVPQLAA